MFSNFSGKTTNPVTLSMGFEGDIGKLWSHSIRISSSRVIPQRDELATATRMNCYKRNFRFPCGRRRAGQLLKQGCFLVGKWSDHQETQFAHNLPSKKFLYKLFIIRSSGSPHITWGEAWPLYLRRQFSARPDGLQKVNNSKTSADFFPPMQMN